MTSKYKVFHLVRFMSSAVAVQLQREAACAAEEPPSGASVGHCWICS